MINPHDTRRWTAERVLSTFLIAGAAAGCSSEPPALPDIVRPVKTMVVAAGEDIRTRSFPGKVEASRRAELAFQVPGLLVKFPVKEGQKVTKGDTIAELRQDEFRARLTALQGQLNQGRANLAALRAGERPEERRRRESQVRAADAQLANRKAELDRATQLLERRAVSRADFDIAETNYRVAIEEHKAAIQLLEMGAIGREEEIQAREAEVSGLEGRVVEASIQLADTVLRAPYDGVIARRFVEEGQNVQAKAPIVRFQDTDEVEIQVDVPESVMVTDIRTADIVQLVAELGGAPGVQFPVHIREVSQVADPTTQTFNVRVAMQSPADVQALPGMTATITANYRRSSSLGDRILIPVSAVSKTTDGESVAWIIGVDGTVSRRPVAIGEATGGDIEITSGLAPGDRIAVAGVSFLRDGMKVRDLGDMLGGSP
jgi:RND family efflux transporter MFP subunit